MSGILLSINPILRLRTIVQLNVLIGSSPVHVNVLSVLPAGGDVWALQVFTDGSLLCCVLKVEESTWTLRGTLSLPSGCYFKLN